MADDAATDPMPARKAKAGRRRQRARPDDDNEAEEGDTAAIKQARTGLKGAIQVTSAAPKAHASDDVQFKSTGEIQQRGDGGLFRGLDVQAGGAAAAAAAGSAAGGAAQGDGLYHGQAGYKDWREGFRKENAGGLTLGPQRVSSHVRTTLRVDYQPDICKDYKETGFCSYGDTCKFLHDRGDYKAGWELDRDWEAEQKEKRERQHLRAAAGKDPEAASSGGEDDGGDDDGLPFACFACRQNWPDAAGAPIKTQCGHYLCERCALMRDKKSGRCPVCEQPLRGVFNAAPELMRKFNLNSNSAPDAGGGGGAARREDAGGWGAGGDSSSEDAAAAGDGTSAAADTAPANAAQQEPSAIAGGPT